MKLIKFILLLTPGLCFGQRDAELRQFLLNRYFFNPANVADDNKTSFSTNVYLGRDIVANPATAVLVQYQGAVIDQDVSFGLSANYDNNIVDQLRSTRIGGTVAYKHTIAEDSYFRLGTQVNVFRLNDLDPLATPEFQKSTVADVDFGFHYQQEGFFFGASSKNIIQSQTRLSSGSLSRLMRHIYLSTGFEFEVSEDVKVTPAVFMRRYGVVRPWFDLHTQVELYDFFRAAITVQVSPTLINLPYPYSVMLGWKLSENFRFDVAAHLKRFNDATFNRVRYEFSSSFAF